MPIGNLNSLKDSAACTETHLENDTKDGYRVRVCLQRYFSDERSRAYVSVMQQRPVRWLHQRLKNLFGLKGPFCLCSSGYFLPFDEPLSVLQPNDPVEVIPMSEEVIDSVHEISSKMKVQSYESANSYTVVDSNATPDFSTEPVNTSVVELKEERDNALLCMKQQALAILETCCEDAASAEFDSKHAVYSAIDVDKPRRTRRRLRRRKRHQTSGESHWVNMDLIKENGKDIVQSSLQNRTCTFVQERVPAANTANAVEELDRATVRDDSVDTRRARLVRSISPART